MTTINVDGEVFDAPRIRAMAGRVQSSEAERDDLRAKLQAAEAERDGTKRLADLFREKMTDCESALKCAEEQINLRDEALTRLEAEFDATCNAEELRQVREDNKRLTIQRDYALDDLKAEIANHREDSAALEAMRETAAEQSRVHIEMHNQIVALEAEVAKWKAEWHKAKTRLERTDCRNAGEFYEMSGSHCPLDRPCDRCEREREERALLAEVARLKKPPTTNVLYQHELDRMLRTAEDRIAELETKLEEGK